MQQANPLNSRLVGILLGTAVGDSLGLPAEGLSPSRCRRLFKGPWRQRFILGHGMISDDTEHSFFIAQSLLQHPTDCDAFQKSFAGYLRWWFLSLPAGVGKATAKACLRLWIGFSPKHSGIFSAGNGPAMRSALIGGFFFDQQEALHKYVTASTQITHKDPKANVGALAVAVVAAWAVIHDKSTPPNIDSLGSLLIAIAPEDKQWQAIISKIREAYSAQQSITEFAVSLGLQKGVTGYIYHTVPMAIYVWLVHYGDFRVSLESALNCGGDTDTMGAIVGALSGATLGAEAIPEEWLSKIIDWPLSVELLKITATRLEEQFQFQNPLSKIKYCRPAIFPRNILFLVIVLLHGFRRLLPPY